MASVVGLLVGPVAGVVVDRCRKKPTMIATDLTRAGQLVLSAVFVYVGDRVFSVGGTLGVIGLGAATILNFEI
jgi:hypothetical protein